MAMHFSKKEDASDSETDGRDDSLPFEFNALDICLEEASSA